MHFVQGEKVWSRYPFEMVISNRKELFIIFVFSQTRLAGPVHLYFWFVFIFGNRYRFCWNKTLSTTITLFSSLWFFFSVWMVETRILNINSNTRADRYFFSILFLSGWFGFFFFFVLLFLRTTDERTNKNYVNWL